MPVKMGLNLRCITNQNLFYMSLRTDAVNHVSHGKVNSPDIKGAKITGVFGENVFTLKTAREYLSDEAYKSLLASVRGGKKIDRQVAGQIASGMRALGQRVKVLHTIHTGFNH
jgi:glutamine synthetase